jgi:pimeloyl-ACP methyl ester carboxylesterase
MKIKSISAFKDPHAARRFFSEWVRQVSDSNDTSYEKINVDTCLGNTVVWAINRERTDLKTIVIFPGFRTCGLFWDVDNTLGVLKKDFRIFLVDINGQPCLSDGATPDIKTNDYGKWAARLLDGLSIEKAIVAGASFGALVCLKLCMVAPELVEKSILLNPGCLQPFSVSLKNLYYNFLPLVRPTRKNIDAFLDNAIFYRGKHVVSKAAKELINRYELFAITQFKNKAQMPYPLDKNELIEVRSDVYLLVGDKDILFPYKKSIQVARKYIRNLKEVHIVKDTGHGIETSKYAMNILSEICKN